MHSSARTELRRGCRVTGIPTVTDKVCLSERCLTVAGHRVRPFSENAHIHCRDYSQPLQRRLVDFTRQLFWNSFTENGRALRLYSCSSFR